MRLRPVLAGLALAPAVLLSAPSVAAAAPPDPGDPAYSVDEAELAAALECSGFDHPEHEPVLLVHGTGTNGHEQWSFNYRPYLESEGFDVCTVTYPDRGMVDMQTSAEYVAWAVEEIAARSGSEVDLMGHSQGALMPRWAIKYWPGVQAVLDDVVLLAGPQHGTESASSAIAVPGSQASESIWQMARGSEFTRVLNLGDETPGDIDYTSVWTETDELVQPPSTVALAEDHPGGEVRNLSINELCPGRSVDHLSIGTTDRAVRDLVVDAFVNDGAADPGRVPELCPTPVADQFGTGDPGTLLAVMQQSFEGGFPDFHPAGEEPPIRPYAQIPEPEVPEFPIAVLGPIAALAAVAVATRRRLSAGRRRNR